jgi:CDP-glucose 4,6-dehydratase
MENMVKNNLLSKYRGKKVFITGHTGFKGSWLTYVLSNLGAQLKGYSLNPNTSPSLYTLLEKELNIESNINDINDFKKLESQILSFEPDFIFHLAAQPLVTKSYQDPLNTYNTNIIGTANLLNSILGLKKECTVVIITTDKVYENKEWEYPYREIDTLGGHDPYSSSKAASELIISSYRNSFFNLNSYSEHKKSIASARAGNVIGGGDWSEDRLIPDFIKAIRNNESIKLRNPNSIRPWQHVLEPIFGYLKLGIMLKESPKIYSGSWNFGPTEIDNLSVIKIVEYLKEIFKEGEIEIVENKYLPHEAKILKLDISKAQSILNWKPIFTAQQAIKITANWYQSFYYKNISAESLVKEDINLYLSLMND